MNDYDDYLGELLNNGKLRPPRGHLWCEKLTPDDTEDVEGLGTISVKERTPSGIILPGKKESSENVLATLYIVRAIGEEPEDWHIRWHARSPIWQNNMKRSRKTLPHTWEEQRIRLGAVISARDMAGADVGRESKYTQIRYDEIISIGVPIDEDCHVPMLPGAAWILVEPDPLDTFDENLGLYMGEGDVYRDGWVKWGTVVALPRNNTIMPELQEGSRVAFPLHLTTGATEYVEFDNGKYRCMPMEDLLLCEN